MKKIFLLIAFLLIAIFLKSQTGVATASLQTLQLNAIKTNSVVGATLTAAQGDSLKQIPLQLHRIFQDGSGNSAIMRLNDIYTSVYNSNTNLGYIKDSLSYNNTYIRSSMQYTTVTFTVTSTNAGTVTVQNRAIGNLSYSVTLPSGTWQINAVNMITVSGLATANVKIYCMKGDVNIPTSTDHTAIDLPLASVNSFKGLYKFTTANFNFGGNNYATAMGYPSTTGIIGTQSLNAAFSTQIIFCALYDGAYTPNASQKYVFNVELKRLN